MPNLISDSTLEKFSTFGDLLRFLRRRAGLTQLEFAIVVGYSDSQISRLEQNMRLPDPPIIEARFVPALHLEDQPLTVARLLELASNVRREDAPVLGMCPYKGLDYFDESDADLFLGREAVTAQLTTRVLDLVGEKGTNRPRFFAVVGASGSGKSSLVRAGLVPALRWNKASANWQIYLFTPTAHPLESLATSLTRENSSLTTTAVLMDDLEAESRSLNLFINRQLQNNSGSYFLLMIDQFEELFTLCRSPEEQSAFIDNLLKAATELPGHAIVVITLRSDFYTHCAGYPQLREALATHQEYIGAMTAAEMRRSIEEPAQRGRWEIEPGLVDLILHDVGNEPGALPLLSHALLETWQRRHGRMLTLSGYASAGGVRGAIAETAEAVFTDQFSPEQQAIARRIFLRLTELGDETASGDTRRRVTLNELILKPEESEATQYVLKALSDARLVTTSEDSVEVAHEALIREWPTLRGWLEDNREALRFHRQLTDAAQEWNSTDHQPDLLYRGVRLAQSREWSTLHADDLNTLEKEFLEASLLFSEMEAAERDAQQLRELAAARRLADTERQRAEEGIKSTRRLRRRSILVSVVGVMTVLLAAVAIIGWRSAAAQAAVNQSLNLAAAAQQAYQTGQGDLALALALEAVKHNQPPLESLKTLRSVALGSGTRSFFDSHLQKITAIAISPDVKTLIIANCASLNPQNNCLVGELVVWNMDSWKELHRWIAHSGRITVVAFSSDGQTLVSGGTDGSLLEWDIDGKPIRQLLGHRGSITGAVFVPGTNNLLSGSADGYLILSDLSTGYVLQRYKATSSPVTSMAISGDGLYAVSAYQDGSIRLWYLNNREPISVFRSDVVDLQSVAISPDGRWILYTNNAVTDPSLRMVNSLDGSLLNQQKLDCLPGQIALSPDGSYVLITCTTTIIQMDIQSWNVYRRFSGHGEVLSNVSISPDGSFGISASSDGSIRLWNLKDQLNFQIKTLDVDNLNSLAISSDGKYLGLNDYGDMGVEGTALWDIVQNRVVKHYYGGLLSISPNGIKISSNDHYIAAVGIQYYELTSVLEVWGMESQAFSCIDKDITGEAKALVFSPDNQHILVGTQVSSEPNGGLFLYDIQTCQVMLQFETKEDVSSIAFNTDGTLAITGSGMLGRVILWDVTTGKEVRRFSYSANGPVSAVAFGPGDSTVLGSGLGEIYLWDVKTGDLLNRYIGLSTFPRSLAVNPDGKYVLSGTTNGDLILWDFSSGEELHRINTGLAISSVLFSPDGKTAYAAALEGKLIELHIDEKSLPELLDWIKTNRFVRELTCAERQQYHIDPQCKQ